MHVHFYHVLLVKLRKGATTEIYENLFRLKPGVAIWQRKPGQQIVGPWVVL